MSTATEEYLERAEQMLDDEQQKWLRPLGPIKGPLHRVLYALAWCTIRCFFRFQLVGKHLLPAGRPVIFAPNHESSLDAALLAAALPYQTLRHTHWAARKGRVTPNPVVRLLSRTARAVPVDRNTSALAAGAAVLQREGNLVWFPEGTRSRDGDLQDFKYGVGALALHFKVPIVPVAIEGSFEALPPEAWFPRLFSKISVRFGDAILPEEISSEDGRPAYECVAAKLRERVQELLD